MGSSPVVAPEPSLPSSPALSACSGVPVASGATAGAGVASPFAAACAPSLPEPSDAANTTPASKGAVFAIWATVSSLEGEYDSSEESF